MNRVRNQFTVAVDGPVAAGKGTLSRAISRQLGFAHLDTGMLYRAVARRLLDGMEQSEEANAEAIARNLSLEDLERDDLRTREVSLESSRIAALPEVRAALLELQRDFPRKNRLAVLDGRDIGTVVCPDADIKFFVTADDEVRARRRHKELLEAGGEVTYGEVLRELRKRDLRDSGRSLAALRKASDAVLLDTSELTIEQAVERAIAAIEERIGTGRDS